MKSKVPRERGISLSGNHKLLTTPHGKEEALMSKLKIILPDMVFQKKIYW